MFGKKKEESMTATIDPAKDQDVTMPMPSPAANRPAMNPEIARRTPDLSAYGPRAGAPNAVRNPEAETKKLIVGRDILLNGQIRTCDSLYVEGKLEAVLTDCKAMEIAAIGEFKGSAEVDLADISGLFDGDLIVRTRLTIRASGRVMGKIRYAQLEIERGGIISGQVEELTAGGAKGKGANG